jgi:hypothetical protein
MKALMLRFQMEAVYLCSICGDLLHQIGSHAGHGHTPWG